MRSSVSFHQEPNRFDYRGLDRQQRSSRILTGLERFFCDSSLCDNDPGEHFFRVPNSQTIIASWNSKPAPHIAIGTEDGCCGCSSRVKIQWVSIASLVQSLEHKPKCNFGASFRRVFAAMESCNSTSRQHTFNRTQKDQTKV